METFSQPSVAFVHWAANGDSSSIGVYKADHTEHRVNPFLVVIDGFRFIGRFFRVNVLLVIAILFFNALAGYSKCVTCFISSLSGVIAHCGISLFLLKAKALVFFLSGLWFSFC